MAGSVSALHSCFALVATLCFTGANAFCVFQNLSLSFSLSLSLSLSLQLLGTNRRVKQSDLSVQPWLTFSIFFTVVTLFV